MTRAQAQSFRAKITGAAAKLTDKEALESIVLFESWSGYRNYVVGDRVRDGENLYRCYNAISANTTWRPSVTPAHWEKVTVGEDGTVSNPITAAAGMRYFKGLYYAEGDAVYLCIRDDTNGVGTILQYVPSQLEGSYFQKV